MANIIISNNSLVKLIIRKGTDTERLNVVLADGELGYTTDSKRLYIGDGINLGGYVVGNKFKGITTNPTVVTNVEHGDFLFRDTSFCVLTGTDSSNISHYYIAPKVVNADGTLNIGTNPPTTATSPGSAGQITWSGNYIYMCVEDNKWKRATISTWS